MKTTDPPIVKNADCKGNPGRIWKALTDSKEMRRWFFKNIPEFEPRVGFTTEFVVDTGEHKYIHLWEVTEAIPDEKITTVWEYRDNTGKMKVTFEIKNDGESDESEVELTCEILEDFTDDNPDFSWKSCEAGWEYFLQKSLPEYLSDGTEHAF